MICPFIRQPRALWLCSNDEEIRFVKNALADFARFFEHYNDPKLSVLALYKKERPGKEIRKYDVIVSTPNRALAEMSDSGK